MYICSIYIAIYRCRLLAPNANAVCAVVGSCVVGTGGLAPYCDINHGLASRAGAANALSDPKWLWNMGPKT